MKKTQNNNITGSVQKKNNKWYIVINMYDDSGKRKQKWISTDLELRGNKKKAENMLELELEKYASVKPNIIANRETMLFCDYLNTWLLYQKSRVDDVTYASDELTIRVHLYPYFNDNKYLIKDINSDVINKYFYDKKNGYTGRKGLSGTSLQRHHATLSSVLKKAISDGYVNQNSVNNIAKPKNDTKKTKWYNADQIQTLIGLLKENNSKLLLPVILASHYGLRREEVCGIKVEDIDFVNHMLFIQHSVVTSFQASETGKVKTVHLKKDELKNSSSKRCFPIFSELEEYFQDAIENKNKYKELLKSQYNMDNVDYIFVHENGNLMTPDYISHAFSKFIAKHNLPKITFHGLRHSCASMLLSLGYSMKEIQEWLGHSSYNTTAKIYAHVDQNSKINMTNALSKTISI